MSSDPSVYRERERQMIDHVERLLSDERLRVDTTGGRWPVTALRRDVVKEDREVELKRLMSELGRPDRELQARMPTGRIINATLSRTVWLVFRRTVGRVQAVCLSPWRELLEGRAPQPIDQADLKAAIDQFAGGDRLGGAPATVVMVSTSGFTTECRELAERWPDRTVILAEPNHAGGWRLTGPPEAQALADLFDPELDADKRQRIRSVIEESRAELLGGGLAADRIAARTQLSLHLVEDELKSWAARNVGLVAKRLGGNVVLFREGNAPLAAQAGGSTMAFIDRLRAMFSGKVDNEKKIGLLSERRAALSIQRDRAYEEMDVLEQKEGELREQFKATSSGITRRRITTQLVQLRKDLERRQQLLGVLNQQVNVISTHLHNLELVQQGQTAQLPDSEELANDAAAAEEVLAELQANTELAATVAGAATAGLSEEEQALYEELEREAAGAAGAPAAEKAPPAPAERAAPPRQRAPADPPPLPARPERRRGEPEPG